MIEPINIVRSAFSGSLQDIASQYEILASMSQAKREKHVIEANKQHAEIEALINSDRTKQSIDVLLYFQYLARFKFKLRGGSSYYGGKNYHAMSHMIDNFVHVCNMAKVDDEVLERFRSFINTTPPWNIFYEVSYGGLINCDFYTKVNFVSNTLYGVSLPNSKTQDISSWISSSGLSENAWDWEYKNEVEAWNKHWFKSKKTLRTIQNEWKERKTDITNFITEVSAVFPKLYDSNCYLDRLIEKQLQGNVDLVAMNKAYVALKEGVKLKHLLLEEGHELARAWNNMIRGL